MFPVNTITLLTILIDCSGSSQVGFKWLKRLYLTSNPSPRSSQAFDDIKLEYKTMQRYLVYKIFVPPTIRYLLPIPGGYDRAGSIRACIPKPGVERCAYAVNRLEGHRSAYSFRQRLARSTYTIQQLSSCLLAGQTHRCPQRFMILKIIS